MVRRLQFALGTMRSSFAAFALILSLLLATVASTSAFAGEALFGPEFNFTSQAIREASRAAGGVTIKLPQSLAAQAKFADLAMKKCPDCKRVEQADKLGYSQFKIQHPDGWSFFVSIDPGVVEVQTDPMTAAQIASREGEIQRLIFDVAKETGLYSHDGAGHIHIGVDSAFGANVLLFRNFLADWLTHSKMAYDIFDADKNNAPTVDMIGEGALGLLKEIFAKFDASQIWSRAAARSGAAGFIQMKWLEIRDRMNQPSLETAFKTTPRGREMLDLSKAILGFVYCKTCSKYGPPEKYQNTNLLRMTEQQTTEQRTVELRSAPEVRTASQYTSLTRLLQGRINYLSRMKTPLKFEMIKQAAHPNESVDLFFEYASRSGVPWKTVAPLMVQKYRVIGPSSKLNFCADVFASAI